MDREIVHLQQLLMLFEKVEHLEPPVSGTLVIRCGIDHVEHISYLCDKLFAADHVPGDIDRIHVYGMPNLERERLATVGIGAENERFFQKLKAINQEVIMAMGAVGAAADEYRSTLGMFVPYLTESQENIVKAGIRKRFLEETTVMSEMDFAKLCLKLEEFKYRSTQDQARRRGKKKRGHNADRDRVIGGKAGYC